MPHSVCWFSSFIESFLRMLCIAPFFSCQFSLPIVKLSLVSSVTQNGITSLYNSTIWLRLFARRVLGSAVPFLLRVLVLFVWRVQLLFFLHSQADLLDPHIGHGGVPKRGHPSLLNSWTPHSVSFFGMFGFV